MNITRSLYGANWVLHLAGNANEAQVVAEKVNWLYNFGFITNIPDDFKAGTDTTVVVRSDRKRFLRGCLAAAQFKLTAGQRWLIKEKAKWPKRAICLALLLRAARIAKAMPWEKKVSPPLPDMTLAPETAEDSAD